MPTRIVCISDTHELHDQVEVPAGDILIHAGDFTMMGELERIREFDEWLGAVRKSGGFRHVIVIAGNHDLSLDPRNRGYVESSSSLLRHATYLDDSGCEVDGLKVWGSPISPMFLNWAFMRETGEEIQKHWRLIPDDTDILITHTPPEGILDQPHPKARGVGCADLLRLVRKLRPRLHVFGHIHGGYGRREDDGTIFVNACSVDEQYCVAHDPIVVEL